MNEQVDVPCTQTMRQSQRYIKRLLIKSQFFLRPSIILQTTPDVQYIPCVRMHSSISSQPKDKYFSKSQGKISRGTHIEAIEDISRSLSLFGASESVQAQTAARRPL